MFQKIVNLATGCVGVTWFVADEKRASPTQLVVHTWSVLQGLDLSLVNRRSLYV